MWDKMKRTLEDVFSGGDWTVEATRHEAPGPIAIRFGGGPAPDILDLLREQGVPTSFFLSGSRPEQRQTQRSEDLFAHYRVRPEPFFAHRARTEPFLTRLWIRPSFVRLPDGNGDRTLKVYRLLRNHQADCILVRWVLSSGDGPLTVGGLDEEDLVVRCRRAVEAGSAGGHVTGTLILMIESPADIAMPLTARVAPLLLREMLAGAQQRQWALVGIGAPAPAST